MRYEGKIKKLDQIIVSDPSYAKDVWCRYENDSVNMKDCSVALEISRFHDIISAEELAKSMPESIRDEAKEDLEIEGIDFKALIYDSRLKCSITENGFTHPIWAKIKEFTIGMDTACVAIGANEIADKIRAERDSWQPSIAINTLTDGKFGVVCEGRTPKDNHTTLIFISGSFDNDTEYTEEDIKNYLESQLQIEDLHLVETEGQMQNEMEIGGI